MSESKRMDLDFASIPTVTEGRPDKATAKRIATEAGSAEGFTNRTAPAAPTLSPRRRPNIQLNLKVPEEFRDEFQAAFVAESAEDRSIRSAGEFMVKVFNEWKGAKR